jgi:Mg-chelatase subunit ChlD
MLDFLFKKLIQPVVSTQPAPSAPAVRGGLVRKIFAPDRIGLVGFHDRAFVIARPAEPFKGWLQDRAQQLHDKLGGSGTNIAASLRVAVELLEQTPPGVLRRVWLLSDGEANREVDGIMPAIERARAARVNVNVNCIGIGDSFDEALLRRIAAACHNGKFVPITTLRELTDALLARGNGAAHLGAQGGRRHHRSETTVIACDCSLSMSGQMDGKPKIRVVEEAVMRLLLHKQCNFA